MCRVSGEPDGIRQVRRRHGRAGEAKHLRGGPRDADVAPGRTSRPNRGAVRSTTRYCAPRTASQFRRVTISARQPRNERTRQATRGRTRRQRNGRTRLGRETDGSFWLGHGGRREASAVGRYPHHPRTHRPYTRRRRSTGGGHRHGTGKPGKTEFPAAWKDEKIIDNVLDVARKPDTPPVRQDRNDTWLCAGTRANVEVSAVVARSGEIVTGWPEEGGPGVVRNPRRGTS